MTKRWVTVFFVLILVSSLLGNYFLLRRVLADYKAFSLLKLDPLEAWRLRDASKQDGRGQEGGCRVVLYGDSRIAQWRPRIHAMDCKIINRAISGQTTEQLKLRLERDVLSLSPDLVVFQAGINDLKNIGLFPDRKEYITSKCVENLEIIIGAISGHRIPLVVLTIFPTGRPDFIRSWVWSDDIVPAIQRVNAFLHTTADGSVYILDAYRILVSDGYICPQFKRDLLHINKKGYEVLDEYLQSYFTRLISN